MQINKHKNKKNYNKMQNKMQIKKHKNKKNYNKTKKYK